MSAAFYDGQSSGPPREYTPLMSIDNHVLGHVAKDMELGHIASLAPTQSFKSYHQQERSSSSSSSSSFAPQVRSSAAASSSAASFSGVISSLTRWAHAKGALQSVVLVLGCALLLTMFKFHSDGLRAHTTTTSSISLHASSPTFLEQSSSFAAPASPAHPSANAKAAAVAGHGVGAVSRSASLVLASGPRPSHDLPNNKGYHAVLPENAKKHAINNGQDKMVMMNPVPNAIRSKVASHLPSSSSSSFSSSPKVNSVVPIFSQDTFDAGSFNAVSYGWSESTPSAPPPSFVVAQSMEVVAGPRGPLVWSSDFGAAEAGDNDAMKGWRVVEGTVEGNWDLQRYSSSQVSMRDGRLRIEAVRQPTSSPDVNRFPYLSGRVESNFAFTYGRVEASIRLPKGAGLWPALWLLPTTGTCWPLDGEIDIAESQGTYVVQTMTWGPCGLRASRAIKAPDGLLDNGFHTFSIDWRPDRVIYAIDNIVTGVASKQNSFVPSVPMRFIANLAVGGDWPQAPPPSTAFPARMEVEYIRLYA